VKPEDFRNPQQSLLTNCGFSWFMQRSIQVGKMKDCTMAVSELKAKAESLPCVLATKADIADSRQFHKEKAAGKLVPWEKVKDELGLQLTPPEHAKLAAWEESRRLLGVNVRRRAK
jgi:hypothetical protein